MIIPDKTINQLIKILYKKLESTTDKDTISTLASIIWYLEDHQKLMNRINKLEEKLNK